MYVDRNSTKGSINIANGSTTTITGTVYAASVPVIFAGGATFNQMGSQHICDTLNISNNAYIGIVWSSSTVPAAPPAGGPGDRAMRPGDAKGGRLCAVAIPTGGRRSRGGA